MTEHGVVAVLRGVHNRGERALAPPPLHDALVQLQVHTTSLPTEPGAVSTDMTQLEQRVQERVASQLEQLEAQLRLRYEQEFESARRLGYTQGQDQSRQESQKQTEAALQELKVRWMELERALTRSLQQHQHKCEDLAVAIGYEALTRILGDSAGTLPQLQQLVAQAAQLAGLKGPLKVRVSPQDWLMLQDAHVVGNATSPEDHNLQLTWQSDVTVEVGSCLIDTSLGTLDARLTTQLQALREQLLQVQSARTTARDLTAQRSSL